MITVTRKIPYFDTFDTILSYDPSKSLFFDIETTGFSPSSTVVFLIGILRLSDSEWVLTQFLAQNPEEEQELLQHFLEIASGYDTLIHFNGSTFDLPYIKKKAARYQLPHTLEQCRSLDLYRHFRPMGRLFALEHMNQKALEEFLGWKRTDQLTGKHMVSLFHTFAASEDPKIRDLLLLHNHDDMVGMTRLLEFASYQALFEGEITCIKSAKLTEHSVTDRTSACIGTEKKLLQISFTSVRPVPAAAQNDSNSLYHISADGCSCVLTVPVLSGTLLHFFADYKNYYYLPLEDQAVHKSVAGYVDKAYREPAKASTCYIKKDGLFLPQPKLLFSPEFQISFRDTQLYFFCCPEFIADPKQLLRYTKAVLTHIYSVNA